MIDILTLKEQVGVVDLLYKTENKIKIGYNIKNLEVKRNE